MKHRWVLINDEEGNKVPVKLSDYLYDTACINDDVNVTLEWKKVEHSDASIDYVCFHNDKQVGFIPIDWLDDDLEMANYWEVLKTRGLNTLDEITIDVMDRYLKREGL